MKKLTFAFIGMIFICSLSTTAFAAKKAGGTSTTKEDIDAYDYDSLVKKIKRVTQPHVDGDYLVFTARNNARSVGIAFDFEEYKTVHQFTLHKSYDYNSEILDSWFYFIMKKPKKASQVSYRLVIDGLWTTDPNNERTVFDESEGILLSQLVIPNEDPAVTETLPSGITRFVCFEKTGQNIRIGGSFTNWDSWIYTMTEVSPGRYEIDIPLPQGTHYYSYYKGITAFIDSTNPLKGYSNDGKVVSRIEIE